MFAIGGNTLWQIVDNNPAHNIKIGTLPADASPAIIQSNGFQLGIASAGQAFIAPGGGAGVQPIVDIFGAPVLASSIAFIDEYFVVSTPNSKQIQISALAPNGGVWDPSQVAIKEAYSDNVQRVWTDTPGGEYLWLFGTDTIEVWTDTAGLFPFSRVPGLVFSIGLSAPYSLAGVAGNRFWLWKGIIWGCSGFQPVRMSDNGIEEAIKTFSLFDQQNAEGFSWIDGSHIYYCISFSEAGRSFVYDLALNMWHERLYFFNGSYGRYRPRVITQFQNMNLVGDYASGAIYKMDPTYYFDAPPIATPAGTGVPLRWERICPYVTDSLFNDRYNQLRVDMDTGVGLSIPPGNPGFNPQVMMRYSIDRGKNWSNEQESTIGEIGQDLTRLTWPQLGASRIGMTIDLYGSDPVPTSINAAFLDIGQGTYPRR